MFVRVAQLIVTRDLTENKNKILHVLNDSEKNEYIVFPEGILSGYFPEDPEYLNKLHEHTILTAIAEIKAKVIQKSVNVIFGTAYYENDWYNSSIYIDKIGNTSIYHKNNLANLDRKCFKQGNKLDIFNAEDLSFGIQMCRELVFPEQWKVLKKKGAQVIFHINNSIKVIDEVRKHILITRAFENQLFVCSVNNAATPQTMPSMVISPTGKVLFESKPQQEQIISVELNLSEVSNQYLEQERSDLMKLVSS